MLYTMYTQTNTLNVQYSTVQFKQNTFSQQTGLQLWQE